MRISIALLSAMILFAACSKNPSLDNGLVRVEFSNNQIASITDHESGFMLPFNEDGFTLLVDDDTLKQASLQPQKAKASDTSLTLTYETDQYLVTLVYELRPGWRFVSKQLFIGSQGNESILIKHCTPLHIFPAQNPDESIDLSAGKYGIAARYGLNEGDSQDRSGGSGVFYLIQNPYTSYRYERGLISGTYPAQMIWDPADGAFPTDRVCIGVYPLTGLTTRHDLLPEWSFEPDPDGFAASGIRIDLAEIKAITDCARAFLMVDPTKAVKVHIGWCENDYQIDMAKPAHRDEYKRIIDQAAAVGCEHVLYTPNHSTYGPLENNRDAWGWENLLWLGIGQKIRTGEWVPGKDSLPSDIQEMIDYAKLRGVKLMAYAYPSLPFMQDSAWTAWRTAIGQKPEHYLTVDTGLKSFQDWWVDMLITFYQQTGISGYSFDHWWIAYTDSAGLVSSKYQQWFGTRRILEELRKRAPEIILDGRQQYHHFGTWTWLAGTYPHPMMSDEQPGSFNPFPDLSTDRISANRQRYVAHRLMVRDFTPIEILPGFITHQTQRSDANRVMRRDHYRTRDWDVRGWKYSIISTVATAPFNLVVNYLPARDPQEFEHFSQADKDFFNRWLNFCDENLDILRNLRPIIGQPMVGRCDGTSAIDGDHGFVFIFNPNQKDLSAEFILNQDIGLSRGERFLLKQRFPETNLYHPHPGRDWFEFGDTVRISMSPTSAQIIEIEALQGDPGSSLKYIQPRNAEGEVSDLFFIGREGATHTYQLNISQRTKDRLALNREKWPISYTNDDLEAPWIGPDRLLLFINIADPYREKVEEWKDEKGETHQRSTRHPIPAGEIIVEIDNAPVTVKGAYNGIYEYETRTFVGYYTDLSRLQAERTYKIEITVPEDLREGQFLGGYLFR